MRGSMLETVFLTLLGSSVLVGIFVNDYYLWLRKRQLTTTAIDEKLQ